MGKNEKIGKAKPCKKPGVPDPHFELYHYAGNFTAYDNESESKRDVSLNFVNNKIVGIISLIFIT